MPCGCKKRAIRALGRLGYTKQYINSFGAVWSYSRDGHGIFAVSTYTVSHCHCRATLLALIARILFP